MQAAISTGTKKTVGSPKDRHTLTLVERLRESPDYQEYVDAFRAATGLPLELTDVNQVRLSLCSSHPRGRASFCSIMAGSEKRCETCQKLNESMVSEGSVAQVSEDGNASKQRLNPTLKTPESVSALMHEAGTQPKTFQCFAGLYETLVPVHIGNRLVAYLQTGQVLVEEPDRKAFRKAVKRIGDLGVVMEFESLEQAYFETTVVPVERYEAMMNLLKAYARHLSHLGSHLFLEMENGGAPKIAKAKEFVRSRYDEALTLEMVAKHVGLSPFHFSKVFKQAVGMKFTEYLSGVRVERAKSLLLDSDKQIGQVAYEAGFQSLAPFNRAFMRFEGETPRDYRRRVVAMDGT